MSSARLRLNGAVSTIETASGVGLGVSASGIGGVLEQMWAALPREQAQVFFDEGRAMSADDALAYAIGGEDGPRTAVGEGL